MTGLAGWILMAAGLVLAAEGLVLALAPRRIDRLIDLIRAMPAETRRLLGLTGLASGTALIWLARIVLG